MSRFDFVCVPIVHPRFERDFILNLPPRPGPLTRSDLCLASSGRYYVWCCFSYHISLTKARYIDLFLIKWYVAINALKFNRNSRLLLYIGKLTQEKCCANSI